MSGISSSSYSFRNPSFSTSGSSNSASRHAASASSPAYCAALSVGTSAMVICFFPLPINSVMEMLACPK